MMRKLGLSLILFIQGCTFKSESNNPIILITVDSLNSDQVSCLDEPPNEESGLKQLCSESVRFSHAFTPSILQQAALSSVLTAKYPIEHRVFHNGDVHLSAEQVSVAEVAVERHYRTAFFSGGPPIFRRSGLAQGFEVFDDNIEPPEKLYKSAGEVVTSASNWLNKQSTSAPLFLVLYLNDLQFPEVTSANDIGELRGSGMKSQLQEIDEALLKLIKILKSKNIWDNSYIILAGLNGTSFEDRKGELPGTNLQTENSQVSLLIKPPTNKRDLGMQWTVDENVSLVDVGVTLFEILGKKIDVNSTLPKTSLVDTVVGKKNQIPSDRPIMLETSWPSWREAAGTRYGFITAQFLLLFDQTPKAYNTLVDRLQMVQMGVNEVANLKLWDKARPLIDQYSLQPWIGLTRNQFTKNQTLMRYFSDETNNEYQEEIFDLVSAADASSEIFNVAALAAINLKSWKQLKKIAEKANEQNWKYLVDRVTKVPTKLEPVGCLSHLLNRDPSNLNLCDSESLVDVDQALMVKPPEQFNLVTEKAFRHLLQLEADREIAKANYAKGLMWDTAMAEVMKPSPVELLLLLPEFEKLSQAIDKRFKSIRNN